MREGDRVTHDILMLMVMMFICIEVMLMAAFRGVDMAFMFVMMFVRFVVRTGQKS